MRAEQRKEQGKKLRSLYRMLALDRAGAAKLLHVSARTIYNWESGRVQVPDMALRLLRLLTFTQLPGKAWEGWCFNRNRLWSPEGHGFEAKDFAWLSNTIGLARMFPVLCRERQAMHKQLVQARHDLAEAEARATTAEGHAGIVELALSGALARWVPEVGDRDGPVTRPGSLTGETNLTMRNDGEGGTSHPVATPHAPLPWPPAGFEISAIRVIGGAR